MGKGCGWHVRVAYQIVIAPEQFVATEAADLHEVIVGVGQGTLEIGGGENIGLGIDRYFTLADRQIDLHGKESRASGTGWVDDRALNSQATVPGALN